MVQDGYGSHLLVFEKLFETIRIGSILEFGMGLYSTPFFARHCDFLASVEQESMEWYRKTVDAVKSPNWSPHFEADPDVIFEQYDRQNVRFDLVLSDGMASTRCRVANLALRRGVPFVVLHDAEKISYYNWNLLDIPAEYFRFDFRRNDELGKVTTILAGRDIQAINRWTVPEHERIVQAYLSPLQPVIQFDTNGRMQMLSLHPTSP